MNFYITKEIFEQYPDLKVGVILIKKVSNFKRVSAAEGLLRGITVQKAKEFKDKNLDDEPLLRCWDYAYGKFGVNPKKYPPALFSLLKNAVLGQESPHTNLLMDLINYFSLKHLLSIRAEDIDWLCGDLRLAFTAGDEPFRPTGSIKIEKTKEGEAAYLDNGGITCRYWNHQQCERTKLTHRTANALLIVEDLSKTYMDQFGKILRDIQEGLSKYIGGEIESYILTEENSLIDLGVEGRKNVNDAKISKQEQSLWQTQKV